MRCYKNNMIKKAIYLILTIISMFIIFNFSSKNSNESNSTSKTLIKKALVVYEKIFDKKVDTDKLITKLNYPVRKLAHFSIYFLLGICVYQLLRCINFPHQNLIALLICATYASFDEIHQLYVGGRTGQVRDVLIDSLGALISILIMNVIYKLKHKNGI